MEATSLRYELHQDFEVITMPTLTKKRLWFFGGVISILAVATATYLAASGSSVQSSELAPPNGVGSPIDTIRPVKVYRVKPAQDAVRSYTGIVSPRRETDLGFRVPGKVVARLVEVGDRVTAGQVISQLDAADYELAVNISEAELVAAEAEARNASKEESRYRELSKSGAASASEVDRAIDGRTAADARVDRAKRALAQAQNRLKYCTLSVDVDGVITTLPVEIGQVVGEGTSVARVAHAGELEAVISLPENRADDAKGVAQMTVWGEVGTSYDLTLRELSPSVDPTTRTYQARFTIQNPGVDVTLGRTATVRLRAVSPRTKTTLASTSADENLAKEGRNGLDGHPAGRDGYFVPLAALFDHEGQQAVWRVVEDRLEVVPIDVLAYQEDEAVVRGDLQPGDAIVAAGVQKIDASFRVRPWEGK